MQTCTDVLIIGGGLAGLTSAMHLSKANIKVILVEKNPYPNHKVCGEYISNEVLPYLNWLGIDIEQLHPSKINHFTLSTRSGKTIHANLPLGGFGISRYTLDHFIFKKINPMLVEVINDTVTQVDFKDNLFTINTQLGKKYTAKQVLGAYGKRATIDQKLNRDFMTKKSPYLAVKAHYSGHFDAQMVALHHFKGGYCGISKVEDNKINICYLADYQSFKSFKNVADYQHAVLCKNPHLKAILEQSTMLFEQPISISQIYFGKKRTVDQHILMIGDTAGLIHPLCGNGMAMAIQSAQLAAELLIDFLDGKIDRETLEKQYTKSWNQQFKTRLAMGRFLSALLSKDKLSQILIGGLAFCRPLLKKIITKTHGKPITLNHIDESRYAI